jgi:hypothetical protein
MRGVPAALTRRWRVGELPFNASERDQRAHGDVELVQRVGVGAVGRVVTSKLDKIE